MEQQQQTYEQIAAVSRGLVSGGITGRVMCVIFALHGVVAWRLDHLSQDHAFWIICAVMTLDTIVLSLLFFWVPKHPSPMLLDGKDQLAWKRLVDRQLKAGPPKRPRSRKRVVSAPEGQE